MTRAPCSLTRVAQYRVLASPWKVPSDESLFRGHDQALWDHGLESRTHYVGGRCMSPRTVPILPYADIAWPIARSTSNLRAVSCSVHTKHERGTSLMYGKTLLAEPIDVETMGSVNCELCCCQFSSSIRPSSSGYGQPYCQDDSRPCALLARSRDHPRQPGPESRPQKRRRAMSILPVRCHTCRHSRDLCVF